MANFKRCEKVTKHETKTPKAETQSHAAGDVKLVWL